MNRRRINRYKSSLEKKRSQIAMDILERRDSLLAKHFVDMIEEISANRDQEMAVRMINRESRIIQEIDVSLERMDKGDYGYCLRCQQPIQTKRLKALPWASCCLRCQEAIEQPIFVSLRESQISVALSLSSFPEGVEVFS